MALDESEKRSCREQIVPVEVTIKLLLAAIEKADSENGSKFFLIDGFPRSLSNLEAFEAELGTCAFMLFLEVSETEMEARLLKRGETSGRSDDNSKTIAKRFATFVRDSMPVVDALRERDCVRVIDADGTEADVFARACDAFSDQQLEPAAPAADAGVASHATGGPPPPDGFEWGLTL